ncbi:MAG: hypothetical protein ACYTE3_09315, partial [Planctomycetota bacterium]
MAGMFYSLQEALDKLNMTEEEIKQVVADGRLREFRDGANLLFKVEEVEGLIPQAGDEALEEALEPVEPEAEDLEPVALEPEELEPAEPEVLEPETLEPEDSGPAILQPEDLEAEAAEPADAGFSDFDIEALGDTAGEIPDIEALESEVAEAGTDAPIPSDQAADTDEILLAPETGAAIPSDLTDADTAITSLGTNVLGETGGEYDITDDTMAETSAPMGSGPEVPLEEIEEDVNLDSFGSGSGLLDLSLQADDTSLGGILDEIYTADDEGAEPVEADIEAVPEAGMAVEAEEIGGGDDLGGAALAAPAPVLARAMIDAPPDAQSNTLGILLFLPLLIVIYTTVVAVSGVRGVMPSILASIQSLIWPIMGG